MRAYLRQARCYGKKFCELRGGKHIVTMHRLKGIYVLKRIFSYSKKMRKILAIDSLNASDVIIAQIIPQGGVHGIHDGP